VVEHLPTKHKALSSTPQYWGAGTERERERERDVKVHGRKKTVWAENRPWKKHPGDTFMLDFQPPGRYVCCESPQAVGLCWAATGNWPRQRRTGQRRQARRELEHRMDTSV
jgi:hypothetical protein